MNGFCSSTSGDHLDRSQMVLVELVSAEGRGQVDISTEQARAQQLVAANRLYRQTALKTGDTAMASMLDELERTLVDIAASPSTLSQNDLDQVRRRIESKGLLFKVRVVSSQVRERQKAAIQERTGQRTLDDNQELRYDHDNHETEADIHHSPGPWPSPARSPRRPPSSNVASRAAELAQLDAERAREVAEVAQDRDREQRDREREQRERERDRRTPTTTTASRRWTRRAGIVR